MTDYKCCNKNVIVTQNWLSLYTSCRKNKLTLWPHQLTDVVTYLPVGSHSTSDAIKCSQLFINVISPVS